MSNKQKLVPHYRVQNLSNLTTNYLTEATLRVLHTSSTFERDYIVDKTPYIKSGRNGWVPANYEASAADLQKRKEAMDDLRKTEVLTPPAPLVEAVKDSGTKAPRLIKADEITDSKQTKNKDKE